MMQVGFVYLVFLPSILTTPLAGTLVAPRRHAGCACGALSPSRMIGLPLLLSPILSGVLTGMVLVAVGTFFAQAIATGFVSRAAETDRGVRERDLSRQLFLGRIGRQHRAGRDLRSFRLARLRRRHRRRFAARRGADVQAARHRADLHSLTQPDLMQLAGEMSMDAINTNSRELIRPDPGVVAKHTVTKGRPQRVILVLQGGGALGAYQAGVYQALAGSRFAAGLGHRHIDRRHQCQPDRRQRPG